MEAERIPAFEGNPSARVQKPRAGTQKVTLSIGDDFAFCAAFRRAIGNRPRELAGSLILRQVQSVLDFLLALHQRSELAAYRMGPTCAAYRSGVCGCR